MKFNYLSLWALAGSASAYLATTTRYYDGQEGACGCGSSSGPDSWQLGITTNVYTAAGSQALFDTDGSSWCGGGCGKCYNLTSTGSSPCDGCGEGGVAGESIIVMVSNLCPYNGNEEWCPSVGATNDYGYSYHFDIMAESEVFGDNVVVDFEPVACPGQAVSDWETCVCYGQTDSDTTPAGFTSAASAASSSTTSSSSTSSAAPTESSTTSSVVSTSAAEVASVSSESTSTSVTPVAETTSTEVSASSASSPSGSEGVTSTYSVILTTTIFETSTIWATATNTVAASSTSSSSGAVQSLYGQCGGINWTGATSCVSGATCKVQNPYYYQCVSSSD